MPGRIAHTSPDSDAAAPGSEPADIGLVADIGGTNARFALVDTAAPVPALAAVRSLPTADHASLQHAARHYLDSVGAHPRRAAFALACPVAGDPVRLTNRAWSFTRQDLKDMLALDTLVLVNDFGAIARAVPVLGVDACVRLHGPADAVKGGPVSVIGPGTGLGIGLLLGDETSGWHVVETEGGHASFAPLDAEEQALVAWITARHGRASWERLLSGSGLATIDAVLRADGPTAAAVPREPADVLAAALDGRDDVARRALSRFCAILGSVAGDVALLHGARSVVIAGGIVPRMLPFLRASGFRERFLSKGRFASYLEDVCVHVIVHPHPGLVGAAAVLHDLPG